MTARPLPLRIGLTGSIGMGKSTAAAAFASLGLPVHSADEAVHRLYGGRAAPLVDAMFPGTVAAGVVDRERLAARVLSDPEALRRLEALVHPLVREEEDLFVQAAADRGERAVVLDVPLLFETGREGTVDVVVVVSASAEEQRRRVLARPGMSEEKFGRILAAQLPDGEKRRRADFVVDTSGPIQATRERIHEITQAVLAGRLKERT